jgi:hypothetical protein
MTIILVLGARRRIAWESSMYQGFRIAPSLRQLPAETMSMADSIKERLPRLLVMIEDFGGPHDQGDSFRHPKWKIRNAAWAALDAGMRTAAEILDAGDAFIRAASTESGEGKQ